MQNLTTLCIFITVAIVILPAREDFLRKHFNNTKLTERDQLNNKHVVIRGPSTDELDATCAIYNGCLMCVREVHGDNCTNTFTNYKIGELDGEQTCQDVAGTCQRDLCMCDLAFAKSHAAAKDQFNNEKHGKHWDPYARANCDRSSVLAIPQCCQSEKKNTEFIRYNGNNKRIGSAIKTGETCLV